MAVGSERFKTKIHTKGGKSPVWNETMNFTKTIDVLMVVEVFDEELIKDDVIGMTTVALRKYLNSPGTTHNGSSIE